MYYLNFQDGGLVVIGQEQDERGDDFSAAESFRFYLISKHEK